MFFIQGSKKAWALGSTAIIRWGMQLGGHNFGVTQAWRGPAEPGLREVALSLRRVYRDAFQCDQLQMVVEITQHHDKSQRATSVIGSMDLHGEALDDFIKRCTSCEPPLMVDNIPVVFDDRTGAEHQENQYPRWTTARVFAALTPQAKKRTSMENVQDVLDGLRRMGGQRE